MTDRTPIVDPQGRPARDATSPVKCPRCAVPCPPGDVTKRTRSAGFGPDVHDVCLNCGHDFVGELTV
jgi:hypothetical protein